jgi:hypothetical protein
MSVGSLLFYYMSTSKGSNTYTTTVFMYVVDLNAEARWALQTGQAPF